MDIALISRELDNWLSRLPNDILKQIAAYFLIPEYEEFERNQVKWRAMHEVLSDHIEEYDEEIEDSIYGGETFEQFWTRSFNLNCWVRASDYSRCGLAEFEDCFCGQTSYDDKNKWPDYFRLKGTQFYCCRYAMNVIEFEIYGRYSKFIECLKKYYDTYLR